MSLSWIVSHLASICRRHARLVLLVWLVALGASGFIWHSEDYEFTPTVWVLESKHTGNSQHSEGSQMDPGGRRVHVVCAGTSPYPVANVDDVFLLESASIDAAIAHVGRCYEQRWFPSESIGGSLQAPQGASGQSRPRFALLPEVQAALTQRPAAMEIARDIREIVVEDIWLAERAGLPIAFAILFLMTRSLRAASTPFLVAGAAVAVTSGVLLLVVDRSISVYAMSVTVMVGMALGVDYTLLCLQRYREERRAGRLPADATRRSFATAGSTVAISAAVVVVSLAGLLLVPINAFRDVGIGTITVVGLGLFSIVTLLPGLLAWSDRGFDRHKTRPTGLDAISRFGKRVQGHASRVVTRYPVICVFLVLAVLGPFVWQSFAIGGQVSIPQVGMTLENADNSLEGYLERELHAALLSIVDIAIQSDESGDVVLATKALLDEVGRNASFAPMVVVQEDLAGTMTVVRALVVYPAGSPEATEALSHLRMSIVPTAGDGLSTSILVSGPLPVHQDVADSIDFWQVRIGMITVTISAILLALVFRSVTVSLLAVVTTCLSVSAAIGVVVVVVQNGHGAGLLGLTATPALEQWMPIVVFCIVFGLSMDYHVFVVSRIREELRQCGDLRSSIHCGLSSTSGVICGAALIMAVVFAGFIFGRIPMLQQVGLGLTAAVLIDAFLVRLTLVPACMVLLGKWNWPTLREQGHRVYPITTEMAKPS